MFRILNLSVSLLLTIAAAPTIAAVVEINPNDDLEVAVAGLSPGDELVLQGGIYFFDENVTLRANGTADQPIVIRAKAGEKPVVEQATDRQNVVEVRATYLVLRGIAFTGGSHGIRLMDSNFVTIENCEVYETGDVGISANAGGTYEGLRILRNHIHHTGGTGEGMYLGCNNDNCRIANSLIEGNYIHHTNGPDVSQGDGIEVKEGSYGNIVRDNVIHDTKYPGILLYSVAGNGAANIVEGNVIWNVTDNTMQIAADAVVRNNIVLGNVALQPHQAGSPSNLEFVHNTIISAGSGVSIRGVTGPVLVANNAIYAQGAAINLISGDRSQVEITGNVGIGGLAGASFGYSEGDGIEADFVNAHFGGEPPIDVFPASGSALTGAGDLSLVPALDFNGTPRNAAADVGAYAYTINGNPGWTILAGFKRNNASSKTPEPPTDVRSE